jgi:hypothetical protein
MRGTVRQDEHRVWGACVALAADRRASATAGSRYTDRQAVPPSAGFGKETEMDAGGKSSVA